jgi:hypothetical protein
VRIFVGKRCNCDFWGPEPEILINSATFSKQRIKCPIVTRLAGVLTCQLTDFYA